MTSNHRLLRKGFTIIEMLFAVILIATLSALLGELFMVTFSALRDAAKRDNEIHRIDAAIAILRRDVWSANAMANDGPRLVDIDTPRGRITWRVSADGTLSRTEQPEPSPASAEAPGKPQHVQAWPQLPQVQLEVQGSMLTVNVAAGPKKLDSLTLVSQKMLQEGRRK